MVFLRGLEPPKTWSLVMPLCQFGYRKMLVRQAGLEPAKPSGGRFTVSSDCRYTTDAYINNWGKIRTCMSYHNPNRSRTGNYQTSLEVCLAIQPLNYVSRIFLTSYYCMVFGFSTQNRLTFYSFEKVLFLLPLAPFEKDYKTSTLGLVAWDGIEPSTYGFSVHRSTTELPSHKMKHLKVG